MWQAWDLALDVCLSQLPAILKGETIYEHSPFFEEQLTAFEVWLSHGSQSKKPEQLPILLQVILFRFFGKLHFVLIVGVKVLNRQSPDQISVALFLYIQKDLI